MVRRAAQRREAKFFEAKIVCEKEKSEMSPKKRFLGLLTVKTQRWEEGSLRSAAALVRTLRPTRLEPRVMDVHELVVHTWREMSSCTALRNMPQVLENIHLRHAHARMTFGKEKVRR